MVARFTSCVLLLIAFYANAQQFSSRFRKIEDVVNAHQSNLFTILKDSEGYLWFGTDNGLARYDASTIMRYAGETLVSEKNEGAVARIVYEDSVRNLLTITSEGKVLQYDRFKDRFYQVNDSATRLGKTARSIVIQSQTKFWVAHLGEGLAFIDLTAKSQKWYTHDPDNPRSLGDNFVTALMRDKHGTLWVGTTSGLFQYNNASDDFDYVELTNRNPEDTYRFRVIRSLAYDSVGDRLFIGTYGGLHVLNIAEKKQEHLFHNPANTNTLSINSIFTVLYDYRNNGLWIGTYGGGLNYYNLVTQKFQHWFHDPADRESIGSDNIPGIYLDWEGLLWLATAEAGLYMLNTNPEKFNRIIHQARNAHSISQGLPRAVYAENDSIIWIGFNGTGLNRMNIKNGQTTRYLHDPSHPGSIAHNAVIAIDGDRHGRIWIGLEGGGVAIYNYQENSFEHLRYQEGKVGIQNDATSGLLVDDDWVWITAFRSPLTVYNMKTKTYSYFNTDSLWQMGISFHSVNRIRKFDNRIWFETNHGTVVFDKQARTFQKLAYGDAQVFTVFVNNGSEAFNTVPHEVQLLLSGNQVHVAEYNHGDSLRTRLLYDGSHHPFKFADLVLDRNKVLWIATEGNLISFNTRTQQERIFTKTDGLENVGLSMGFATDKLGRIYTKSSKGLVWFDPLTLNKETEDRFDVKFTTLKIFNQEVTVGTDSVTRKSRLPQQIGYTRNFQLYPSENFFSLSFTALYYVNPDQVNYRYRLVGFNNDWIDNGTTNFASFTNLNPGFYRLEVMATTNPLLWGSNRASIDFEVLPPFWRTWWFLAALSVSILSLLFFIHQYRISQKLQVERLRTKIASDLHDEIGSSLTRISMYSELLSTGTDQEKISYQNDIREISREVVSTMSDIVWSIDNRSDTLGDLILRMKDFALQFLTPKNIDVKFITHHLNERIVLTPQLKQNLYLIYKESLHNVVKHSEAKNVIVEIQNTASSFSLVIIDDGKGFDNTSVSEGNGLRNMQRRANDIQANLSMEQTKGTKVILKRLPLL